MINPSKFSILPQMPLLRSIIDLYFEKCHNQPYRYFSRRYFYKRLEEGQLPSYLLMAILAAGSRYSPDTFFNGQQRVAIETFSRVAWNEIFERFFSDDDNALNITFVQAANLLAVVDFTSKAPHGLS